MRRSARPPRALATLAVVALAAALAAGPAAAGPAAPATSGIDDAAALRAVLGGSLVEWSRDPDGGVLRVGVVDLAVAGKVHDALGPAVEVYRADPAKPPLPVPVADGPGEGRPAADPDPASPAGRADALLRSQAGKDLFGAALTEWWTDPATGVFHVGVADPATVPAAATAALAATGATVEPYPAARGTRLYGRLADSVPWYGGIRLYHAASGTGCSANFTIVRSGVEYVFSAGHCGSRIWTNNGVQVGSAQQQELSQNGWDDQIIGFYDSNGGSPSVYTGCNSCGASQPVKTSAAVATGGAVCFAGSYTGENCAGRVGSRNVCHTFSDDITTCHLSTATSADGSALSQAGDSGGTIYRSTTGGVAAAGMIIGASGTGTYYFHEVPDLLGHWGASLQTA